LIGCQRWRSVPCGNIPWRLGQFNRRLWWQTDRRHLFENRD
jgi:hypothetical protein